jgi:hypothetical protein
VGLDLGFRLTLSVTYGNHVWRGYDCLEDIILLINNQITSSIRSFFYCAYFVEPFNYFERLGLVIFKYHMLIRIQQVVGRKSAMPYDYPHHVGNSSWLSNHGQAWAHFRNHMKKRSQ